MKVEKQIVVETNKTHVRWIRDQVKDAIAEDSDACEEIDDLVKFDITAVRIEDDETITVNGID